MANNLPSLILQSEPTQESTTTTASLVSVHAANKRHLLKEAFSGRSTHASKAQPSNHGGGWQRRQTPRTQTENIRTTHQLTRSAVIKANVFGRI